MEDIMKKSEFASTIKEARIKKELTQQALSEKLHVTNKAISKWERGLSYPDIELLEPLARELGIPLAKLLGVEEPNMPEPTMSELASKLLSGMKDRIQDELLRKKHAARVFLAVAVLFFMASLLIICFTLLQNRKRQQQYFESEVILSFDELENFSLTESDGQILFSYSAPSETASRYMMLSTAWYDKKDPSTVLFHSSYMSKPYLIYDSADEFEAAYNADTLMQNQSKYFYMDVDRKEPAKKDDDACIRNSISFQGQFYDELMPQMDNHDTLVNRIVYQEPDGSQHILWERQP